MLKVGVIGVGYLGRHHARIYAQMPGVTLVGVSDLHAERGQAIAAEYGTKFFADYREMLGQVEAVSLAVPTIDHCEIGCELLRQGIAVLVEKPIARTLAEADQMIQLAEKHNVCLQVGHLERFNPAIVAVRPLVKEPRFFETHRLSLFSPRSLDIDVVMDLMIHDLDIIASLVKSPIVNIHAVGVAVITPKFDIANARIEFASGCIANITASRISTEKVRKLRLFQPHDYISIDYITQQAGFWSLRKPLNLPSGITDPAALLASGIGIEARQLDIKADEPLRAELAAFVQAVTTSEPPPVSGAEGRHALALALQVSDKIAEHARKVGLE